MLDPLIKTKRWTEKEIRETFDELKSAVVRECDWLRPGDRDLVLCLIQARRDLELALLRGGFRCRSA